MADFLRHLGLEKNASAHTVKSYREDLQQALGFFRGRLGSQTAGPGQLSTRLLRSYVAWLHEQDYARTTIARRLAAVRSWCRYLCRQGVLEVNPADGLRGPRQDKKLPHFLNEKDMARLLAAPAPDAPLGLRDRAILETRAAELAKRYPGEIPRPLHWTGFSVHARTIEFWRSRPDRLHDRMLYTRTPQAWQRTLLYP